MNLRSGKFGEFYGCSKFPKCKGTRQVNSKGQIKSKDTPDPNFVPNHYQKAVMDAVMEADRNIMVQATAGSGKTKLEQQSSYLIPRDKSAVYLVFGARDRDEAQEKMPSWVPAMSTHQFGLGAITTYLGRRPEIDDNKVVGIIKSLIQESWDEDKWMISPTATLIGRVKNTLSEVTDEALMEICYFFGDIDLNGEEQRVFDLVRQVIQINDRNTGIVDFDDMLYFPNKFNMPVKKFDWVLGDEVQDWNQAQIDLISKASKSDGRVLFVGDDSQAMYQWRGAALDAMNQIKERFDCEEMPLSITYRCPLSVVRLVNTLFPDIVFESAPNAREGEVTAMSYDKMLGDLTRWSEGKGSKAKTVMVLCRVNAPLVQPAFALIRQGVKAVILGREIGTGLVNLIDKLRISQVDDLLEELIDYRDREVAKLLRANQESRAAGLMDRVATIVALSEGCRTASDIKKKIEEVFSDSKVGVVFASIHKAKGGEADDVYLLRPDLLPHPMAKPGWQMQQEDNIAFVAHTRPKQRFIYVGSTPDVKEALWEDVEKEGPLSGLGAKIKGFVEKLVGE